MLGEGQLGWRGCPFTSPSCPQETSQEPQEKPQRPKSFKQKQDYFQKMGEGARGGRVSTQAGPRGAHCSPLGPCRPSRSPLGAAGRVIGPPGARTGQQQITVKTAKPPPKVQIPQDEEQDEEKPRGGGAVGEGHGGAWGGPWWGAWGRAGPCGTGRGLMCFSSFWSAPSPPPPPVVKSPPAQGRAKAAQEVEAKPVARGAEPSGRPAPAPHQRAEPSREIRNIIRMYQSRPGPVPMPVQPTRWALGATGAAPSPGSHPGDSGPLPSPRKPPKNFLKKNNPKDEALAKLGISDAHAPAPVRPQPVQPWLLPSGVQGSLG